MSSCHPCGVSAFPSKLDISINVISEHLKGETGEFPNYCHPYSCDQLAFPRQLEISMNNISEHRRGVTGDGSDHCHPYICGSSAFSSQLVFSNIELTFKTT